ncbi:exported hypothetical protein [Nitrospina gracilis 3/211]|uniref:Uncharacterized protein n=1 Tax=Nitrospina gracilis (strain 3/211) TaxID=1266370 RepID=M1ZCV1_NITG3|nr:hypothetical protein [Nitrospina gracilis]CCQ91203.1 exported hypothetical protein [Nitrospina gracilis 3/211]
MFNSIFKFNQALVFLFLISPSTTLAEEMSLSTSRVIGVQQKTENTIKKPCEGKKAQFGNSYVTLELIKMTVNKDDNLVKRILNSNRASFPVAKLNATYKEQNISISKVGSTKSIIGGESSLDMGVEWVLIDRLPWVLKAPKIEIKLGYTSDSTLEALAQSFSEITNNLPNYTVSSSIQVGLGVAQAIDKLLFGDGRSGDLLKIQKDLPLIANQLCEGYYAIFGAEKSNTYEKYYKKDDLVWTGHDLQFKDKTIKDASFIILRIVVSDRYYMQPEFALNDTNKPWTRKYSDLITGLFELSYISTSEGLKEQRNKIRNSLLEAKILLNADLDLIFQEKLEIHSYALKEANKNLKR